MCGEREASAAEAEEAGGGDEEPLVVVAASEGDSGGTGTAAERQGLRRELAGGERSVAVGDLVEAGEAAGVAAGDVEAVAEGRITGYRGEGG